MISLDQYLHAATRDNTRKSYQAAVKHFEVEWGGFLPTTANSIAQYLVAYAEILSSNTLKQRLSALAQWHIDQGFPDPTKTPIVKKAMRGIQALHPVQEKQARPLQLAQLEQVSKWLDQEILHAKDIDDRPRLLRHSRDKALLLLGFWRGFRGDELSRLEVQNVEVVSSEGMTVFLSRTKGDRSNQGTYFKVPALSRLCPVDAYLDWIYAACLTTGPVFRRIDRWGHVGDQGLHIDSLVPVIRSTFMSAGVPFADQYSSHSLRRGFANWATSSGWSLKTLMEYVGWKSVQSAIRYVDAVDPFGQVKIENALSAKRPNKSSVST